MMRIFLIRHGETEWNRQNRLQGNSDTHLSPEGFHQAITLSEHAPFHHVDAIYSSDLTRALSTANILAERFDLTVKVLPELRETDFGDWEGRFINDLFKESPKDFGKFFTDPERCHPPNGETFLEAQARVMIGIREIIANHDNQNVVVVSHGAAIRLILGAALDMPIHKMWAIAQFNMALNILRVDDGDLTVELMNSTEHLHLT
ncbi:MAG: histidine phosphatase family protein [Selenomonadaceae bacterium]|nr:histidine phosphatase family protein [Selenomonadaceae bacterium]MBQ9497237.1 histidine phosphatase family protein [Selenomonadaceae bacterium]